MKVVINQSNYLPWRGYFDLIHDADIFIFLDDVQYTKNDWRNRNRCKGPNGTFWLTIPVGGSTRQRVCDVALPQGPWAKKHLRALTQSYGDCPHFSDYASFFTATYSSLRWSTLSALNQHLTITIGRDILGVKTQFLNSDQFGISATNQERVLALLKAVGATTYISGPRAKAYLDPAAFAAAGVALVWKDYSSYPEYPQPFPPFDPAVSIVDLLFSTGPRAADYIWGWRKPAFAPPPLVAP